MIFKFVVVFGIFIILMFLLGFIVLATDDFEKEIKEEDIIDNLGNNYAK